MSEKMDVTVGNVFDSLTYDQREMVYYLVGYAIETGRNYIASKSGDFDNHEQRRLRTVYHTLTDVQRVVVDYLVDEGKAMFADTRR